MFVHASWKNDADDAVEHLTLDMGTTSSSVQSVITAPSYTARYRLACDAAWRVMNVVVSVDSPARHLALNSDANGHWTLNSVSAPELDGAMDVDIVATPFTNTLPIRRLNLAQGQSADITVVYISLPELAVRPDQQRYTCLIPGKHYRFVQSTTGFTRELKVDEHGLVLDYPGLFTRV